MSNIVIFKENKAELLESVNTPDYEGKTGVFINPDLSKLTDVPKIYWKIDNNKIVEMSEAEKKVIDDQEKLKIETYRNNFLMVNLPKLIKLLVAKELITKQEILEA